MFLDLTERSPHANFINRATTVEQRQFCRKIPDIEKKRQQAKAEAERARQRHGRRESKDGAFHTTSFQSDYNSEESSEDMQYRVEFFEYKQAQLEKQREERMREKLLAQQMDEEQKKQAADKERQKIENEAIENFKKSLREQQAEREANLRANREALRSELQKFNFSPEQLSEILENIRLPGSESSDPVIETSTKPTLLLPAPPKVPPAGVVNGSESKKAKIRLPW